MAIRSSGRIPAPPSGEQAENGRLSDGKKEEETEAKLQVCDKEPLRPHVDQGMCYNRRPVKCGPEPSEVAALGPQEPREKWNMRGASDYGG